MKPVILYDPFFHLPSQWYVLKASSVAANDELPTRLKRLVTMPKSIRSPMGDNSAASSNSNLNSSEL